MNTNAKHPPMFYGWYIVGAAVLMQLYIGGVVNFGFTAVFEPLAAEFHWSYAQISLASSLRGLEMGLLSAAVGLLIDRWGARKLLLIGTCLIFLGYCLLSQRIVARHVLRRICSYRAGHERLYRHRSADDRQSLVQEEGRAGNRHRCQRLRYGRSDRAPWYRVS